MKQTILFCLCFNFLNLSAQDISAINSGAFSGDNLIYTIGEVFVTPVSSPDEAASGLIGALSSIEFLVTGAYEILPETRINVYPNPTSNTIVLETGEQVVRQALIYSIDGKLFDKKAVVNNTVDLTKLLAGIYIIKTDNPNISPFKLIKK